MLIYGRSRFVCDGESESDEYDNPQPTRVGSQVGFGCAPSTFMRSVCAEHRVLWYLTP